MGAFALGLMDAVIPDAITYGAARCACEGLLDGKGLAADHHEPLWRGHNQSPLQRHHQRLRKGVWLIECPCAAGRFDCRGTSVGPTGLRILYLGLQGATDYMRETGNGLYDNLRQGLMSSLGSCSDMVHIMYYVCLSWDWSHTLSLVSTCVWICSWVFIASFY